MTVEVAVLGSPSLIVGTVSVDVEKTTELDYVLRDRADYSGRGGAQDGHLDFHTAPELLVLVQELCESRGGRPGMAVLTSLLVSVDAVKLY